MDQQLIRVEIGLYWTIVWLIVCVSRIDSLDHCLFFAIILNLSLLYNNAKLIVCGNDNVKFGLH